MATRNQVLSLFGATPEQIMQRQAQEQAQAIQSMRNPYQQVGAVLGTGLARLFGGESPEVTQARQMQEIARDYQPGNLQSMTETYSRLQEVGAPAETLQRLSEEITTRSAEARARNAALEFTSRANPELAKLLESGAISPKDAVEAVRKAQEPIKVGDVLVNVDPRTNKAAVVFDARNRAPATRYEILTPEQKKTLGLPEGAQYQRNASTGEVKRIAGANLPQMGNIPQGYQVVVNTDEQNRPLISMEPIPGSPQARELEKSTQAVQAGKRGKETKYTQIVAPAIDTAIAIAEDPENWATGKAGAFVELLGKITGGVASAETSRLALSEQLTTIRANIGFDRLQKMRDESPTGGALGQVALQELYALQSSIAPLNPNMKDEELVAGLKKVKETYRKAVEAVANDLTDEQLIAEGLADLIPFRTATRNPDGSYTPLAPADEGEFDISKLPQDVQDLWEYMTEEQRALFKD